MIQHFGRVLLDFEKTQISSKWMFSVPKTKSIQIPYSTQAFRNPEQLNNLIQPKFFAFGPKKFIISEQTFKARLSLLTLNTHLSVLRVS